MMERNGRSKFNQSRGDENVWNRTWVYDGGISAWAAREGLPHEQEPAA